MADRIIFHCDLNCFFASVELLDKPALQNVPVAVCGDPASRHGIILAKNEPAKQMGVQTAETVWQAKQKCPHLVLLPPHHSLYADYSRRVNAIYGQYTDLVEPFGIDESWLDVTGSLHLFGGDARQLAACKPEMLEQLMGKTGVQLHRYANGLDDAPVRPQHEHEPVKSVGNSTTFPENLTRWEQVRSGLQMLSDSVAGRLRQQGLYCGGVAVGLRDSQFRTVSRQMRLPGPTHLMRDIYNAALTLTQQLWKAPTPIRLLSVTALYITESADSYQQLDLLAGDAPLRDQRQEQLESAMDAIRGKYGKDAIAFGHREKMGWDD